MNLSIRATRVFGPVAFVADGVREHYHAREQIPLGSRRYDCRDGLRDVCDEVAELGLPQTSDAGNRGYIPIRPPSASESVEL